jgi:hypothetical protein
MLRSCSYADISDIHLEQVSGGAVDENGNEIPDDIQVAPTEVVPEIVPDVHDVPETTPDELHLEENVAPDGVRHDPLELTDHARETTDERHVPDVLGSGEPSHVGEPLVGTHLTEALAVTPAGNDDGWRPSIGVGTVRFLTGQGSGSPIDSDAVVRTMDDLHALGQGGAARFHREDFAGVVSTDPSAPFTGSGATGVSPLATSLPVTDLAAMARYQTAEQDITTLRAQRAELLNQLGTTRPDLSPEMDQRRIDLLDHRLQQTDGLIAMSKGVRDGLEPTVSSYRNPLSEGSHPPDPSALFDSGLREQQARLLLEQPIVTLHRDAYGDRLPTRAEVISAAADHYNLDPAVLGGIILHEQRDQSTREDTADILGGTVGRRDTSIGLGQILMSTAMRDNASLLSDTVSEEARQSLSRDGIGRLLTSDEHNIWATARYIRSVADQGADAGAAPGSLPTTHAEFPGLNTDEYRSRYWSDDSIRALASEYTSKPWDDRVVPAYGYPQFVLTGVQDIQRAGVFSRARP